MKDEPRFKAYGEWCEKHGIILNGVGFPEAFQCQNHQAVITGGIATKEIRPQDVILYVPNKVVISTESVRNSELYEILKIHEDVFVNHPSRDFMTLVFFLIFEKCKGPESMWYEYFECLEMCDIPPVWES